MKNIASKRHWIFLLISLILAVFAFLASRVFVDRKPPEITVLSTPKLTANTTEKDLLNYCSVVDENLKSFIIEESELINVVEQGQVTYVAIDNANNVTKLVVDIDVDPEVKSFHVEAIKPLKLQIGNTLVGSDYFVLKNECGWTLKDNFEITGINNKTAGEYDVKVVSKKHESEPLFCTFEVDDYLAPKITLTDDLLETYTGLIWNDEYFLEFVDTIEDDKDDPSELINKVKTNWSSVMKPNNSGYVWNEGNYTITYSVTDSEGNIGKTTLMVRLRDYVGEGE